MIQKTIKGLALLAICVIALNGCVLQNNEDIPSVITTTTSTTTATVETPIVYFQGIEQDVLQSYLDKLWMKTDVENVYRYWEPGVELPKKTEPGEYDGFWFDFNNKEFYYYTQEPILRKTYYWTQDFGKVEECNYDYKTREFSGKCDYFQSDNDAKESFKWLKDYFESWMENIRSSGNK